MPEPSRVNIVRRCVLILVALAACDSTGAPGTEIGPSVRMTGAPSRVAASASCADAAEVTVSALANIFGAGMVVPPAPAGGGGSVPPVCIVLPDGASSISVVRVTGVRGVQRARATAGPSAQVHRRAGSDAARRSRRDVWRVSGRDRGRTDPTSGRGVWHRVAGSQRIPHRHLPARSSVTQPEAVEPGLHRALRLLAASAGPRPAVLHRRRPGNTKRCSSSSSFPVAPRGSTLDWPTPGDSRAPRASTMTTKAHSGCSCASGNGPPRAIEPSTQPRVEGRRYRCDRGGGGRTSLQRPPDKCLSRIGLTSLFTFWDGVRRQSRWSQS